MNTVRFSAAPDTAVRSEPEAALIDEVFARRRHLAADQRMDADMPLPRPLPNPSSLAARYWHGQGMSA
jgi:hypothetical protein